MKGHVQASQSLGSSGASQVHPGMPPNIHLIEIRSIIEPIRSFCEYSLIGPFREPRGTSASEDCRCTLHDWLQRAR